jgi:hypothetical protein
MYSCKNPELEKTRLRIFATSELKRCDSMIIFQPSVSSLRPWQPPVLWIRRWSGDSVQLPLARSAFEADRLANGRVVLRVGQGDAACANFRLNFHGGLLFLSFGFLDDVSG